MDLHLIRQTFTVNTTIGPLDIDGVPECLILEDVARAEGVKIPKETCIPPGHYRIRLVVSPKHKRLVPLLENVPGFTAIEMHVGNFKSDTEGCLIVGNSTIADQVVLSGVAFDKLMSKLIPANDRGEEIWINITVRQKLAV